MAPWKKGFTVVGINKGDKCFLDKTYDDSAKPSSNEPPDFKYELPQAVENSKRLILHNPSEIWGYDGDQLVIGVVVSCHMTHGVRFVWLRLKKGIHFVAYQLISLVAKLKRSLLV